MEFLKFNIINNVIDYLGINSSGMEATNFFLVLLWKCKTFNIKISEDREYPVWFFLNEMLLLMLVLINAKAI